MNGLKFFYNLLKPIMVEVFFLMVFEGWFDPGEELENWELFQLHLGFKIIDKGWL